jgi:hypothetical protein
MARWLVTHSGQSPAGLAVMHKGLRNYRLSSALIAGLEAPSSISLTVSADPTLLTLQDTLPT